jgi:hypothetical protein
MSKPTVKLTQSELDALRQIQDKYQEKLFLFGQLYVERIALEEKYKQLELTEIKTREEYVDLQKEEQNWLNTVSDKYGDGNLSLKDGTFTPTQ